MMLASWFISVTIGLLLLAVCGQAQHLMLTTVMFYHIANST